MKREKIRKISISLMIALAFILPSGAIMAGSFEIREADDVQIFYRGMSNEIRLPGSDPIAQMGLPIWFGGFFLEYPDDEFPPMGDPIEDGDNIPLEDYYIPWMRLLKEDMELAVVKPHMELYKLTDGIEIIMYETSFEDNYDIYNNWVQIDQDCGISHGYFDTWSWSDVRASDGDHSFKSTMYDIYKGNQDDYFECLKSFNVSDQDAVVVYFDIWVEGQGDDDRNPFDYASFEIGDGTGLWITNLTLDEDGNEYKFFDTTLPLLDADWDISENVEDIGNGWWRVKYRANMTVLNDLGLDTDDLRFRFDWHSDPQFQYEGAYVDNFKVISIESEMEKIYQGHSQGPKEFIHCSYDFEFPLKWYPEEGCYRAILWLEVLDEFHESTFDWPGIEIDFCVGDDLDCEIVDLWIEDSFTETIVADGGIMVEGSDAHIVFTYHQNGTIPSENIVIKASATKFTWETLWETDCEGMFPFPDKTGAVHSTDRDAFSGSQSLGWFDKDTYEYETDAFYYAYGPKVSFEGVEEMYMDVYWKGVTDPGDALYPSFLDSFNGYVLGSGFGNAHGNKMDGYNPTWTGPTENGGKYTRTDLVAMYEWYTDAGYLQDVDGLLDSVPVGFFFTTDGDGENTHPDAVADGVYWSGIFVDDIIITTKKLGEEVWTETMIIPGPLEPCETYTAQFEWEDIPFSNYLICVEAMCEDDVDPDDNKMCQKILVLDYLEHATLKDVESIDYTGDCQEDWGICSSDYDNYLSTNPDSETYASDSDAIAKLCPEGEECIINTSISGLELEFDAWWDLEDGWDYVYLEVHDGCPALFNENWAEVRNWTGNSFTIGDDDGWYHEVIDLDSYVTGAEFELRFRLDSDANTEGRGFIIDNLIINDDVFGPDPMDDMDNWCLDCYSLGDYWDDWCIDIPDLFIDNALIWDTEINDAYEAYLMIDHTYVFQNIIEFMMDWGTLAGTDWTGAANFTHKTYTAGPGQQDFHLYFGPGFGNLVYWAIMAPGDWAHSGLRTKTLDLTPIPVGLNCQVNVNQNGGAGGPGAITQVRALSHDGGGALTGTEVLESWGAWGSIGDDSYTFDPYDLGTPTNVTIECYVDWQDDLVANLWQVYGMEVLGATETCMGYLEISADGGYSWQILDTFTGDSGGDVTDVYDITPWAGNDILIRFRVEGNDDSVDDRFWCINDLSISGKTDDTAPTTTATMSGTMTDAGWYSSAVQVQITAVDDTGMGEIHYILDGSEKIVSGDSASFTVSGNGAHNIEFWGVDAMGNVETPHHIIPTFRIDAGAPPTVAITAPEPGLYLFGNKLLSLSKVFIIGAFDIEATASDAESGVYRIQFYLDNDLISEDTEVPYGAYCAQKHMGAGTIKVVAEDFSGNTAEDTLDITYYKFL